MPTDRISGFNMGVSVKIACQVATTGASITLSGVQTIDGISVGSASERVLVKDQTSGVNNGIYTADSSTWVRAKDCDGNKDIMPGSLVYVDRGTNNRRSFWVFNSSSTASSLTVGTDALTLSSVTRSIITEPYVNALDYGVAGDGVTNDTTALQAALSAAANGKLFIPAGTYKLTSSLNLIGYGISVEGAGQGQTDLRWFTSATEGGFNIYASSNAKDHISVRNLRLTTNGTSTGVGLYISATAQIISEVTQSRIQPRVLIDGVVASGKSLVDAGGTNQSTADGWLTGIWVDSVVDGVIQNCSVACVNSGVVGTTGSFGIYVSGNPDGSSANGYPLNIKLSNNSVAFADIAYGVDNSGSISIANSYAVGCGYGVRITGANSLHSRSSIIGSQFDCTVSCIFLNNQIDNYVAGNLASQSVNSTSFNAIYIASTLNISSVITGNTIVNASTLGAMNGITSNGSYNVIANNIFRINSTTVDSCITLHANSSKNIGSQNLVVGTPVAYVVHNGSSATNTVTVTT